MNLRIGSGYDIHKLKPGNKLILGGIVIPSTVESVGHSDGDVLLHAIIDALLGAAGMGDIGSYYPSSDSKYKNSDSKALLKDTFLLIRSKNYKIVNLDSTVILQQPRLENYKVSIREQIAEILELKVSEVSVKAKTADYLNATGKGEAIEAQVVALLSLTD